MELNGLEWSGFRRMDLIELECSGLNWVRVG